MGESPSSLGESDAEADAAAEAPTLWWCDARGFAFDEQVQEVRAFCAGRFPPAEEEQVPALPLTTQQRY